MLPLVTAQVNCNEIQCIPFTRDWANVLGVFWDTNIAVCLKKNLSSKINKVKTKFSEELLQKSILFRSPISICTLPLLALRKYSSKGTECNITPASSSFINLTVQLALDENVSWCDCLLPQTLRMDIDKHTFSDEALQHVRPGIRLYKLRCHSQRYVPNFINFAVDVVVLTYRYLA